MSLAMELRFWLLFPMVFLLHHGAAVRTDMKSVRYGANLFQSKRSDRGSKQAYNRSLGRLLHQGVKITTSATAGCENVFWDSNVTVAARHDEDVSWMAVYMTPYLPYLVYSITGDEEATHRTKSNVGREAQAYVQFMVDYYDCLPQSMAFIHAHRSSPHSPDMLYDLKHLQWDEIPGFMSMSRPVKNSLFYFKDPSINKPAENDSSETARWSQFAYEQNINIKAHWEELFLDELGPIPDILQSPNCGQFAVTKDRVRARSKEFWQRQLDWMRSTSMDPFWAGLIYEHTWSYMLGAGVNYTHPDECKVFTCDPNSTRPALSNSTSFPYLPPIGQNLTRSQQTVMEDLKTGLSWEDRDEIERMNHVPEKAVMQERSTAYSMSASRLEEELGSRKNVSISLQYRDPFKGRRPLRPISSRPARKVLAHNV